jgi:NCAIR mutase (PurE)-related protein
MTPVQFLGRISALIPPPRYPLVRLSGVFAPRSSWRAAVVPKTPETRPAPPPSKKKTKTKRDAASSLAAEPGRGRSSEYEPPQGPRTSVRWQDAHTDARASPRCRCYAQARMDPRRIRELLERVQRGEVAVDGALDALRELPFRDIGMATVDHHRALRQGMPEVVFGEGKTVDQLVKIAEELASQHSNTLITRLDADKAAELIVRLPTLRYAPLARTGSVVVSPVELRDVGPVAVVTAGTSDVPVAEEAVETLAAVGLASTRLYDVGVAGIHRLFGRFDELQKAAAVIVCAGMEGALPSVVGGLVSVPVVAVPTSVGYGVARGGRTALFAMLTSCASGITVVNIDNGFGAAMAVHRMLYRPKRQEKA